LGFGLAASDLLHRCSVLKLMLNYAAQMQCFEASAPLANADGGVLLHRCSVLKLMLKSAAQVQCVEASAPLVDTDVDTLPAQVRCFEASVPLADADGDADGDVAERRSVTATLAPLCSWQCCSCSS